MNAKTTPKDFFMHLGAAIALYASAIALLNLAFAIVNKALPDALGGLFTASSIVWPVSMLVVLVPILYVLEWLIGRDIAKMPEKKDVWIRKWRIYLKLFLAVALIGGDLIALINVYLNGEVTGRFVWKVAIILVVAGTIGKYYFFSISGTWRWARISRLGNAWFGIILVAAAIVGGFVIVGSPAHQRDIRFDDQRVQDLQNIQYQALDYWQKTGGLPSSLQALNDPLSGFTVPADPETGAAYGYTIIAATSSSSASARADPSFQLCATFDLSSSAEPASAAIYNQPMIPAGAGSLTTASWDHPAGHACFARTIDPALYPTQGVPEK